VALVAPLGTIDLAYQLRLGGAIVVSEEIPRTDTFTFSVAGAAWVDQQWLAQVVFSRIGIWADAAGLAVAGAALIAGSFGLISLACQARGASVRTSGVLALLSFVVAAPMLAVRPQLFGVAGVALALWVVRTNTRLVWLLPAIALALANLHGSFPLIVLIAGLAALGSPRRARGWLVLTATAAATIVTPFGAGVWSYVRDITTDPVIRTQVTEWAAPSLTDAAGLLALASLVGMIVVGMRRRGRIGWIDVVWLVVFAVPAVASQRAVVWWALIAPTVVARWLAGPAEIGVGATARAGRPGRLVAALAAVLVVLALPWWRGGPALEDAPPGVADTLAVLPDGTRVLVYQPWASWIEYRAPNTLTYVDSRIELFPADVWSDYDAIASGDVGRLDLIGADAIAGEATWPPIAALDGTAGWRTAYEGPDGIVLVRG
jgi:hypothetical protein